MKKMMKLLIALLAIVPTAVFAQGAPQDSAPPPLKGRPHRCDRWYPKDAQRAGIEGTTTLAFHITAEGHVTHITIAQSSGSRELDYAAYLCARTWNYLPAMQNGKPIEVPWTAKIVWQVPTNAAPAPDSGNQNVGPTPQL